MILTDSMLEAAFNFRNAEPWKDLTDSDIFAVMLSDGTKVYCSIMGHGGMHHALCIYIGDAGFSTFLMTLAADRMKPIEGMLASIEFDCINCDFMQAKDMDDEVKEVIRDYAKRKSIKIPRKNGWIDFTRHTPYKGQWHITNDHDAFVAEEALRAATFFAKEFEGKSYTDVNLDPMGQYPTPEGGKQIPLITTDETGAYHISVTTTPPLMAYEYIKPEFDNDILIRLIKAPKKGGDLECRLQHLPIPVTEKGGDEPDIMGLLLLVDKASGEVVQPLSTHDYPYNVQKLLAEFAMGMSSLGLNPKQICVSDEKTYNLIEDFCRKCGILLVKVKSMPQTDEVCMTLLHGMMMQGAF